jgi:hypothetical protein
MVPHVVARNRISGSKTFRSSPQNDFFNNIRHKRSVESPQSKSVAATVAVILIAITSKPHAEIWLARICAGGAM